MSRDEWGGDDFFEDDFYKDDESKTEHQLKYIHIERESQMAWLIIFEIGTDLKSVKAWIPKSQGSLGKNNTILLPQWLIESKELEEYRRD